MVGQLQPRVGSTCPVLALRVLALWCRAGWDGGRVLISSGVSYPSATARSGPSPCSSLYKYLRRLRPVCLGRIFTFLPTGTPQDLLSQGHRHTEVSGQMTPGLPIALHGPHIHAIPISGKRGARRPGLTIRPAHEAIGCWAAGSERMFVRMGRGAVFCFWDGV